MGTLRRSGLTRLRPSPLTLKLPSAPAPAPEAPASSPLSFLTSLHLLGILFWLEEGEGGKEFACLALSSLLFLLPSSPCCSRCFLCQPGSTPACVCLVQAGVISPHGASVGCGFPEWTLMPLALWRGPQREFLRVGHVICFLSPQHKTHLC